MRRRLAKGSRGDEARGDGGAALRGVALRSFDAPRLLAVSPHLAASRLLDAVSRHLASRFLVVTLLLVACCALGVAAAAATSVAGAQGDAADGFMRVELPPGRELRVENRLGGVSVELWDEPRVGVAYEIEGGADAGGKSPVRLERTENSLALVVAAPARTARAKAARRVDLRLRVPAGAQLSVFTANGAVEVLGSPARLDAQTVSGDLRLQLAGDADVMARALAGTITVRA
ncbi:MAG TPA: hypothetical protein VIP46_11370, partial [Pyrinomonadaceae bacterium]